MKKKLFVSNFVLPIVKNFFRMRVTIKNDYFCPSNK